MRIAKGILIAALSVGPIGAAMGAKVADPLPAIGKSPTTVEIEVVATGFNMPVQLTHAGDGSGRRFVVDRSGQVQILSLGGQVMGTPFLDIAAVGALGADVFKSPTSFNSEYGLLGMAFHPDYASSGAAGEGLMYTYSSVEPGAAALGGFDDGLASSAHQSVVYEWRVSGGNADAIDVGTRREVMRIDQPQNNHNGGMLAFGPEDGLLYIGLGDGGGKNDAHPSESGIVAHGQNKTTALGSLLRIDPNDPGLTPAGAFVPGGRVSDNGAYVIPASNPFFDLEFGPAVEGLDEVFVYGLRNPYRFSFDTADGDLYIGDVGQNDIEEVDRINPETEGGANLGWNIKEGSFGFEVDDNNRGFVNDSTVFPAGLTDPLGQYDHGDGTSVIGGFVYHGQLIPELEGKYLFGESFDRTIPSPVDGDGRLLMMDVDTGLIEELTIGLDDRTLGAFLGGTGVDEAGEFYITGFEFGTFSGAVLRVVIIPEPNSLGLLGLGLIILLKGRRGANRRNHHKTRSADRLPNLI